MKAGRLTGGSDKAKSNGFRTCDEVRGGAVFSTTQARHFYKLHPATPEICPVTEKELAESHNMLRAETRLSADEQH